MLDIELFRKDLDRVRTALVSKKFTEGVEEIVRLDTEVRLALTEFERNRAEQKQLSARIGAMKKSGTDDPELIAHAQKVSDENANLEARATRLRGELSAALMYLPNLPDADVPVAPDESGNLLLSEFGQRRQFDFAPKAHWDLAGPSGMLDTAAGATLAGSGFNVLRGDLAKLERALISFMIDLHVGEHGFTEVATPFLAKGEVMEGTGQLPKFAEDMYRIDGADLYLIPTAEVTIANLFRDTILKEEELPIKVCGYTPCFRKEAGAAGRDTRGMIRVHQFSKVELVKITTSEQSERELDLLVKEACRVLTLLDLPHRTVLLSTGDMSFSSAKTIDIEVWAPGVDKWLEVSSCSNCRDFQARRMKLRYRDADKKNRFAHTLNGSGVALPRLMIAILENYQETDGRVRIPEPLRGYFGGREFLQG